MINKNKLIVIGIGIVAIISSIVVLNSIGSGGESIVLHKDNILRFEASEPINAYFTVLFYDSENITSPFDHVSKEKFKITNGRGEMKIKYPAFSAEFMSFMFDDEKLHSKTNGTYKITYNGYTLESEGKLMYHEVAFGIRSKDGNKISIR